MGMYRETVGTDVQAYDEDLDDLAAMTPSEGSIPMGDGSDWQLQNSVHLVQYTNSFYM
jgi:hypothetical protein